MNNHSLRVRRLARAFDAKCRRCGGYGNSYLTDSEEYPEPSPCVACESTGLEPIPCKEVKQWQPGESLE